jgi:23S rRNA (adenine2503-C2)-methyltransferase
MLTTLVGLNTTELSTLVQEAGEPAYRGKQLAAWIYQRGVCSFDDMTNLPHSLRTYLEGKYEIGRSQIITIQNSKDGTIKLLLEMHDGSTVEAVGLPYPDRFSCCLSTQVGCPIGCTFCATGLSGYTRNLTAGEIVDQVLSVQEVVRNQPDKIDRQSRRIDHVILMGMGEPLLNYEATIKAVRLLNNELGVSMRHITVSTVGFIPGILRLAQEKLQLTLAVSLHAATDDLRRKLIPHMSNWSIAETIQACREYIHKTGRRVTFEYCLLDEVNDGIEEATELARLLHGLNCHVNLISYNPASGLPFNAPSQKHIESFREVLEKAAIQVTQRLPRGSDIDAACGQLRQRTIG